MAKTNSHDHINFTFFGGGNSLALFSCYFCHYTYMYADVASEFHPV